MIRRESIVLKTGVQGTNPAARGNGRVELKDLREAHGVYFKGPHIVELCVAGSHSVAFVQLTPEACRQIAEELARMSSDAAESGEV